MIDPAILEPGEVRVPKKPSKIAVYQGDIIVLEVHDEPRVDWTSEPTCLVKEGKQRPFVHTQRNVVAKSDPKTEVKDGVEVKVFQQGSML
jgi:hypothetical protein